MHIRQTDNFDFPTKLICTHYPVVDLDTVLHMALYCTLHSTALLSCHCRCGEYPSVHHQLLPSSCCWSPPTPHTWCILEFQGWHFQIISYRIDVLISNFLSHESARLRSFLVLISRLIQKFHLHICQWFNIANAV